MAKKEELLPQLQLLNLRIKDSQMVQQMQKIAALPPTIPPTILHERKPIIDPYLLGVL